MRDIRGCVKEVAPYEVMRGVTISKCPVRIVDNATLSYIEAYTHYKNGVYPEAGGWLDQPMKALEAFQEIGHWVEILFDNGKEGTKKWQTRT